MSSLNVETHHSNGESYCSPQQSEEKISSESHSSCLSTDCFDLTNENGFTAQVTEKLEKRSYSDLEKVGDLMAEKIISRIIKLNFKKKTERVKVVNSLGTVLAEDIVSTVDLPPCNKCFETGYALNADHAEVGCKAKKVVDLVIEPDSDASQLPTLKCDECVKVLSGAPLPPGADVVLPECAAYSPNPNIKSETNLPEVEFGIRLPQFTGVRKFGHDVKSGDVIAKAGKCLNAADLSNIIAVGVSEVVIFKKPTVAVMSTGNEICDPPCPKKMRHYAVYDVNRTSLMSILQKSGFNVIDAGIALDESAEILEKLTLALSEADVIITSGGVSIDKNDLLKPVLQADLGATIHFDWISMEPDNLTAFSTVKQEGVTKLIFALPGDPSTAMMSCILFVIPALRQMEGVEDWRSKKVTVKVQGNCYLDHKKPMFYCSPLINKENQMEVKTLYKDEEENNLSSILTPPAATLREFTPESVLVRLPARSGKDAAKFTKDNLAPAILLQQFL